MTQQLLEAVEAVRFPVPGVCLVLPLLEGTPAVGADKALGVELVPHRCDDSALCRERDHILSRSSFHLLFNINIELT